MYLLPKISSRYSTTSENVLSVADSLSKEYSLPIDNILRYLHDEGSCSIWAGCDGEDIHRFDQLPYLKTTTNIPVVVCPRCKVKQCLECLKLNYISTKNLPTCTTNGCSIPFDEYILKDQLPDKYVLSLRPLIRESLFDMEMSRIPETEAHISSYGYTFLNDSVCMDISGKVRDRGDATIPPQRVMVVKCLLNRCSGFLNSEWECKVCGIKKCMKCHETLEDDHHCNPETIASMRTIRLLGCSCPECGNIVEKLEGCVHMFCLDCKTSYNYVEGGVGIRIPDSWSTNPAYHAWRRSQLPQPTAEHPEVEEPNTDECPVEGDIPDLDQLLLVCASLCIPRNQLVFLEHIHRLLTNHTYGIHTTHFEHRETADVMLARQLLVLARMKAKVKLGKKRKHPITGVEYSFKAVYHSFLKRKLMLPTGYYSIKNCTNFLREESFKAYRIRQRAHHHCSIIRTFRSCAADILRNIIDTWRTARGVIEKVKALEEFAISPEFHHNLANHSSLQDADDFLKIRKEVISQIASITSLIGYTNEVFIKTNETLGYKTYPRITAGYNFYFSVYKETDSDPYHTIGSETLWAIYRWCTPVMRAIVHHRGRESQAPFLHENIRMNSQGVTTFMFDTVVYATVSQEFIIEAFRGVMRSRRDLYCRYDVCRINTSGILDPKVKDELLSLVKKMPQSPKIHFYVDDVPYIIETKDKLPKKVTKKK